MLTPEVIEVPFLSFPSPCKRPWGEGEERNVGTSITSFSSFSCLLFLCQRTQRKDRKKSGWRRRKNSSQDSYKDWMERQRRSSPQGEGKEKWVLDGLHKDSDHQLFLSSSLALHSSFRNLFHIPPGLVPGAQRIISFS